MTSLVIIFCITFWLIFNSYNGWRLATKLEGVLGFPSYIVLQKTFYNFDISDAFRQRGYKKSKDSININLSSEDIKYFQDYYYGQLSKGNFLADEGKDWRKAKVDFFEYDRKKVKVKLHGTAAIGFNAFNLYDHIRWRLTGRVDKNSLDISKAPYGFKLKIKSDDQYVDGIRRMNLISPLDDWDSATIGMNKYISSIGVITTNSRVIRLYVNGRELGPYHFEEPVNKELLERNFQITNYAILANNDDWNKGLGINHISSTDFTSNDMDVSGELETTKIATSQFKRLVDAVNNKDIGTVISLLDTDDIAKVAALTKLVGTNHPIAGDNLKYVYDLARGKFKYQFRLEGEVHKLLKKAPIDFEDNLHYPLNEVIEYLMEHDWFVSARDSYLYKFVAEEEMIIKSIADAWSSSKPLFDKTRFPTKLMAHKYRRNIESLSFNISIIKQYLQYTKVYSTIHEKNGAFLLHLLHDSYSESFLNKIEFCNGNAQQFNKPILLKKAEYNQNKSIISDSALNEIEIISDCILNIDITKKISNQVVPQKHIYINSSKDISKPPINNNLEAFDNRLVFEKNLNGESIATLLPGTYEIKKSIALGRDVSLIISPGVKLILYPDVSIFIEGNFYAEGDPKNKITIINKGDKPFGTIAILGNENIPARVDVKNLILSGGSEDIISGIFFSSQLSAHYADVKIINSTFQNSYSDDGLNIKFGKATISNSIFKNNSGDQIDFDYVTGAVSNSDFFSDVKSTEPLTDGLDVSGSNVFVAENTFRNMSDKAISIGEKSKVVISENVFMNNNIGVATKDGSSACFNMNNYENNGKNIIAYVKKKMYSEPRILSVKPSYYLFQENDGRLNKLSSLKCHHEHFLKDKNAGY
jgi:hypothetical protein